MSVPAAKWYLNPSNGLNRVYECDRRQTDRPRYTKKCRNRRNCLQRFCLITVSSCDNIRSIIIFWRSQICGTTFGTTILQQIEIVYGFSGYYSIHLVRTIRELYHQS